MSFMYPREGLRLFVCLLVTLLLVSCASTPVTIPDQPVKSLSDDYQYRFLTLENELQVLLISDPDTPKAAAALSVMVGSGDNPPGRAGLAHFLEHMLFLGTDKYPDAAEYERYITEHGGSRNAYTAFDHTNYFFDINPAFLPEALDRFAQFFIAPRFDAEYIEREKNAVEAEFQMGLKSDGRRGLDVLQEVMNQEHPYSQFTVGDLQSMADRPDSSIRDDMLSFYAQHYSASTMRLAVLGSQSLDELQALVIPTFSPVPDKQVQLEDITTPMFAPDSLPMLVQVQPLATLRQLEVSFPIADYRDDYRENPLNYLGNLLGHEGEGSLFSQLKAQGLAESLGAGMGLGWPGGALFSVNIALTEKGAADYERVLQLLFAYMEMLRAEGPHDWLYQEQSRLADLGFRYKEQGEAINYVSGLVAGMLYYAPVDSLRGPYMMDRYDAPMLGQLMAQIRPDNALVTLNDSSADTDTVSRYYQVPYSRRPLELARLEVTEEDVAVQAMHLPLPNEFIAEDLSLVTLPDPLPAKPEIVVETPRQTIWYMPDAEFRLPKGITYINFRTTELGNSADQSVAAAMYSALLMDRVNEFAYPARLAGLSFTIYKHAQGISLRVSGYTDKQSLLLERLLADIANPVFNPRRFDDIRADMIRELQNSVAKRPSSQVMDDLSEAVLYGEWGEQAQIAALEALRLPDLDSYVKRFWEGARAQVLVYGNYEAAATDTVAAMLEGLLAPAPAPTLQELRVLKLAAGDSLQYAVDVPHDDSVVAWYLQGGGKSWRDKAATALTAQIMTSGFFQQLRTEQQLGYVVAVFPWSQLEVPGLVMVVQSPVADAPAVVGAMQEFMSQVRPELDSEQFERHRAALLSDILRPDKNLGERAEFYWQSIAFRQLDFSSRQDLAQALEAVTLEDWEAYYQSVFMQQRRSLQVVATGKWKQLPEGAGLRRYESAADIKAAQGSYQLDDK